MTPTNTRRRARAGFTLLNVLITVAVMAMVAGAVAVSIGSNERVRVSAAANLLASDVEFAQSATLSDPDDPLVVRFDPDNARYWVAAAAEPDTPITRPGTDDPYLVAFGEGDASVLEGIRLWVSGAPESTIEFDGFGRPTWLSDAVVRLGGTVEADDMAVVVSSSTGFTSIRPAEGPRSGDIDLAKGGGGGLLGG